MVPTRPSPSPAARFEVYARHVEARAALYARPWYDAAIRAEMALSPADRAIVRAAQELTHEADLAAVSAYRADGFVSFGGVL